ncbi:thioesterase family protein [Ensifer sp. NBAIM29]|nr:thioesterase family protein [Ensifer sp. NBAIM29]
MDQNPIRSDAFTIGGDWIDVNGHMSVVHYPVLFEILSIPVFERLGFTSEAIRKTNKSLFTLETHACYLRELNVGDQVYSDSHYLEHDHNKFVYAQELRHVDGWLSATFEALTVHVDLTARKSAAFPDATLALLDELARQAEGRPRPEYFRGAIGLRRRRQ